MPLKRAHALQRLLDEFDDASRGCGISGGVHVMAVSNLLRLLNLAEPVQTMLVQGDLKWGMHEPC